MTFTLYVEEDRWRRHLQATVAARPDIVPVIKGNGYGLGNARLAAEAARLGVDTVAVGNPEELAEVAAVFPGDVLVMAPAYPRPAPDGTGRVLQTAAHLETVRAAAGARVVVELLTSMHRHGLAAADVADLAGALTDVRLAGLAFHLPMDRHDNDQPAAEVATWLRRLTAAGVPTEVAWVSHLEAGDLQRLSAEFTTTRLRPRVGTALWLGDRGALRARGRVLDVHRLDRGTPFGYRQRRAPRDSYLVVVGGGTAHGVALEAPRAVRGPVARAKVLAAGTLGAANLTRSPFRWAGRQRWFAEPPHMHVSMLLLPASVRPPAIGEELDCEVRLTTLHPDGVAPLPGRRRPR